MKKKIDLFTAVEDDKQIIENEFNCIPKSNSNINKFVKCINDEANISINRNQDAILDLLNNNIFLTGPQFADNNGYKNFRAFLYWTGWPYEMIWKRIEFFESFYDGKKHFFGAINLGCAGVVARGGAYGYYCVILKNDIFKENPYIVYCKHDSLRFYKYWDMTDKKLKVKKILSHYAPHLLRGQLAAIKHKDEIYPSQSKKDYMKIVIQKGAKLPDGDFDTEEYIEACFKVKININSISEIRFHDKLAPLFLEELLQMSNTSRKRAYKFSKHKEIINKLPNNNISCKWSDCKCG